MARATCPPRAEWEEFGREPKISSRRQIRVKLSGGLGNQMMRIAGAFYLFGPDNDFKFIVTGVNSSLRDSVAEFGFRVSGVPSRDRRGIARLVHEAWRYLRRNGMPTQRLLWGAQFIWPPGWFDNRVTMTGEGQTFKEEQHPPAANKIAKVTDVGGRFVDCDYFDALEPSFSEIFSLSLTGRTSWFLTQYDAIEASDCVGIHVRRGDFAKIEGGVLDLDYYKDALDHVFSLKKKAKDATLWLFSDEPDQASADFRATFPDYHFRVVRAPERVPAAEVVSLLAACNIIIAANSTFSWCAVHMSAGESDALAPRDRASNNPFHNCSHVISV